MERRRGPIVRSPYSEGACCLPFESFGVTAWSEGDQQMPDALERIPSTTICEAGLEPSGERHLLLPGEDFVRRSPATTLILVKTAGV